MRDLPMFYAPDVRANGLLPEEEAGHCLRVLRLGIGDEVLVTDGQGMLYECRILEVDKRQVRVTIQDEERQHKTWQGELTLCVAPTKSVDRMEWLVEKAVEIGVDRIVLLRVKHSERKQINVERFERIVLSAMKQSQKAYRPIFEASCSIESVSDLCPDAHKMILHCRADNPILAKRMLPHVSYTTHGSVCIMIGPEGDFSVDEIRLAEQLGFVSTTLGNTRLRTETAALVALQWIHTLQLVNRS